MEISSQELTKNQKFIILESFKDIRPDGKYDYKKRLKCVDCGEEKIILGSHVNRCTCLNCKTLQTQNKYNGQVFGCYQIIKFVRYQNPEKKENPIYEVKCLKCGKIYERQQNTIFRCPPACEHCKGNWKVPTLEAPFNAFYAEYRRRAFNRNFEFNLTKDEFSNLIFSNCVYCGQAPEEHPYTKQYNKTDTPFLHNGIDRIDSNKGYSVDNCVSCCTICNRMKLDYSKEKFFNHIKKIYKFNNFVNEGSTTIENTSDNDGSE